MSDFNLCDKVITRKSSVLTYFVVTPWILKISLMLNNCCFRVAIDLLMKHYVTWIFELLMNCV